MAIARPSRRLFRDIPLPFVARKLAGGSQRPVTTSLSLTSMIDFLVVVVVFLLITFQPAQSEAAYGTRVPDALNVEEMVEAPMVSVAGRTILLDGVPVGNVKAIEDGGKIVAIDELSRQLVSKRETWKQLRPNRPFPGALVLQLDQDTSSIIVKSIFYTAAHSGYPAVGFMVQRAAK